MTPEQRDRAVKVLAPMAFGFGEGPLTIKGVDAVNEDKLDGRGFLTSEEIKKLRVMVVAVATAINT